MNVVKYAVNEAVFTTATAPPFACSHCQTKRLAPHKQSVSRTLVAWLLANVDEYAVNEPARMYTAPPIKTLLSGENAVNEPSPMYTAPP